MPTQGASAERTDARSLAHGDWSAARKCRDTSRKNAEVYESDKAYVPTKTYSERLLRKWRVAEDIGA